jgi:hypothetical protein
MAWGKAVVVAVDMGRTAVVAVGVRMGRRGRRQGGESRAVAAVAM